jgi:hypothetical protein
MAMEPIGDGPALDRRLQGQPPAGPLHMPAVISSGTSRRPTEARYSPVASPTGGRWVTAVAHPTPISARTPGRAADAGRIPLSVPHRCPSRARSTFPDGAVAQGW